MHSYTEEQQIFICENVKGKQTNELTELLNKQFGLTLGTNQIRAFKKNHGMSSGIDAKFRKGQAPFNKGKKKYWVGGEDTQFKKGNKPHNYLPIGTERVNGDNYIDIKIAEPNKWKGKHILVWEEQNGPVPKSGCVIFGDGNNRNLNLDNLICVSRSQLLGLNSKNLIQKDANLTKIGIVIVDINSKISQRRK